MTLAINDTAPDFEADTTEGRIRFHDWIGDKWAVLFSHPKDFTPVCTTELGYMAKIKPEFDRRGVKIIGLSVDPSDKHEQWAKDIEETQGTAPNYPIIADPDFNVSKAYGMLAADVSGDAADRTPADNQTVRNVFVIGPDKKVKLILVYPMTTGRNFDEVMAADALLLGRVTYDGFAAAWPGREDDVGFADKFNSMEKHVVSSTLSDPAWNNSHVIDPSDIPGAVERLKQAGDGDILVNGSKTLLQALMES